MDIAQATAADELWGWPVDVLDRLLVLQHRAWAGEVSLQTWRAEDATLREGHPPVDAEEVGAVLTDWVSRGLLDLRTHGGLLGRLTVLANQPPSDDDLWSELVEVARRAGSADANPRFVEVDRGRRDLIVSWLTRPESGVDPASGVPWSLISRHQEGSSVETAREAALDGLSDDERVCAALIVASSQ